MSSDIKILLLTFFIAAATCSSMAQSFSTETCSNCGSFDNTYLLYLPTGYSETQNPGYSLIINLHGQNEAGVPLDADNLGIPLAMTNPNRDVFDGFEGEFIVTLPSTANTDDWDIASVNDFMDYILANYNVNEDRVFVTGLSMGAKGAWDYALNYPNKVTGIVALMGSAAPGFDPCLLENVAIWSIIGESDNIFPPNEINATGRLGVELFSNQIKSNCNPTIDPLVTILPGKTHSGWSEAAEGLSGFNVFEWMDKFTAVRNGSGVKTGLSIEGTPLVNIGPDRIFMSNEQTYFLHSFILDPNDPDNSGISSLNWSINPSAGNLSDPAQDMLKITSLPVGTYTVQLDVQDNQGNSNSDEIIVDIVNSVGPDVPEITKVEFPSTISGSWASVADLTAYQNLTFNDLGPNFDFKIIDNDEAKSFRTEYGSNFAFRRESDFTVFFGRNQHSDYVPSEGDFVLGFTGYTTGFPALSNPGPTKQYRIVITSSALPVNFIGFTGKPTLNGVELKWLTTDEEGNSHFEIYRGRNEKSFQKIGEVQRAADPQLINEYTFTDLEAEGGVYYYQVKNVDFDGHIDLTEIIRVDVQSAYERYYIYPNPSEDPLLHIRTPDELRNFPMEIQVTNASGQDVLNIRQADADTAPAAIDVSHLAPGLYHLRIFQDGQVNHFRLVRR